MATKEQMKEEAIKRMKKLNIAPVAINLYEQNNIVYCSCLGNLSPLTKDEKEMIEDYTKTWGHIVYHIIHSFSNIGETYELLYVSKYKEDWKWENSNIDSGYLLVYGKNLTVPDFSESGSIIVKNKNGSLFRIA